MYVMYVCMYVCNVCMYVMYVCMYVLQMTSILFYENLISSFLVGILDPISAWCEMAKFILSYGGHLDLRALKRFDS